MTGALGRSGLEVSAIGMGCRAIGGRAYRGDTPWDRVMWTTPSPRLRRVAQATRHRLH